MVGLAHVSKRCQVAVYLRSKTEMVDLVGFLVKMFWRVDGYRWKRGMLTWHADVAGAYLVQACKQEAHSPSLWRSFAQRSADATEYGEVGGILADTHNVRLGWGGAGEGGRWKDGEHMLPVIPSLACLCVSCSILSCLISH